MIHNGTDRCASRKARTAVGSIALLVCALALMPATTQAKGSLQFISGVTMRNAQQQGVTTLVAVPQRTLQETPATPVTPAKEAPVVTEASERNLNRVFLGFRFGWDQKIQFGPSSAYDTGSDISASYEDGFINGSANSLTKDWGFSGNPGQKSAYGTGTAIAMSAYSVADNYGAVDADYNTSEPKSDFIPGFEFGYGRELWTTSLHEDVNFVVGAEVAVNYVHIDTDNSNTYGGANNANGAGIYRVVDTFYSPSIPDTISDNGYTGGPDAIGPSLQTTPISRDYYNTMADGTPIDQATSYYKNSRSFDYNEFGLRLGPTLDLEICQNFVFGINGGLALKEGWSDFNYDNTLVVNGNTVYGSKADTSHSEFIVGGYVGGRLGYKINAEWDIYASVQQYFMDSYKHGANGIDAQIDPRPLYLNIGVGYSF